METFWTYLVIGAGSALGGMGRYGLARFVAQSCGETLPWGTLFINVSGSFAIGLGAALALPGGRCRLPHPWSLFLLTGVSGGYTTFLRLQPANPPTGASRRVGPRRGQRGALARALPRRRRAGLRAGPGVEPLRACLKNPIPCRSRREEVHYSGSKP